jgi:beta-galactosidase
MTISSWVKANGPLERWRTIIAKGGGWKLHTYTDSLKFACGVNVPGDIGVHSGVRGRTGLNDGRWYHVAGVYNGRSTTLYIDGRRDVSATTSGSIPANSFNVWIGADSQLSRHAWNGLIDEVRIYSHALTAEEVKDLYKGRDLSRDKH